MILVLRDVAMVAFRPAASPHVQLLLLPEAESEFCSSAGCSTCGEASQGLHASPHRHQRHVMICHTLGHMTGLADRAVQATAGQSLKINAPELLSFYSAFVLLSWSSCTAMLHEISIKHASSALRTMSIPQRGRRYGMSLQGSNKLPLNKGTAMCTKWKTDLQALARGTQQLHHLWSAGDWCSWPCHRDPERLVHRTIPPPKL